MAKKTLQLLMDERDIQLLENLAGAAGMDRPTYCRTILARFARLKREYALEAITGIPREYFKGLPGRPTSDEPAETPS
jgi:hypothetical protein